MGERLYTEARKAVIVYPITATVKDFCNLSGLGRSLVFELLAAGELRGIKVGTRRLILLESYLEFIDRQRVAAE